MTKIAMGLVTGTITFAVGGGVPETHTLSSESGVTPRRSLGRARAEVQSLSCARTTASPQAGSVSSASQPRDRCS
jgi:hypothetical protein